MGKSSKRKKKNLKAAQEDSLGVIYCTSGSLLYGAILFFKYSPRSEPVTPYKKSAPFVVSETIAPDEVVVHGSVGCLIQDIQRVIKEIYARSNELHDALSHMTPGSVIQGQKGKLVAVPESGPERRVYFEFTRHLAGMLILLSTQARNLFDLFPRLDQRIPLFDANGRHTDSIKLSHLFVHFVHNQYVFLDGEHVSDLFPAKPRSGAPIKRTFMGYRFNWLEYVEAINVATRDVKLKDLTGLLRGRLKKLSLDSPYSDIVFLLQNLFSFSRLLGMKVADERYRDTLILLFDDDFKARLAALNLGEQLQLTNFFRTPTFKIHERLSERKFKITVHYRWTILDNGGKLLHEDRDFRLLTKEVGYEQLLDYVTRAFGNDPLLDFNDH